MNRCSYVVATIAVLSISVCVTAQEFPAAGVITGGAVVLVDPPTEPITKFAFASDTEIRLFQEQSDIELAESVLVDIRPAGSYPPSVAPPIENLNTRVHTGTPVDVYFLHFDPGRRMPPFDPPNNALSGEVTFDFPIAGLIVRQPQFLASEELQHPEVEYLRYTGLEIGPDVAPEIADVIELSPDRRTLLVDFSVTISMDQMRIIVARVPEPSTIALSLLAVGAIGVLRVYRR